MNKPEEIQRTIADYQFGRNGFEKAPSWRSHRSKSWNNCFASSLVRLIVWPFSLRCMCKFESD